MNNVNLLTCSSICKYYLNGTIKNYILKNVSLVLKKGDMLSIIGSSGSGKSTFLHIVGGLDSPNSGEIFF